MLCALEAEAGLSNARLARAAFVTAQTMLGVLTNLERDKLITREPDAAAGRVIRCELTSHGRKILSRAHVLVLVVEERIVTSFGEKAASQLAKSLNRCAEDLSSSLE